ncbi:MAG: YbjN domain-containing protein [Spirochaetaceae bacterium]|nr:YbjN domain-containing protein [Spirochaetaceae bacterium]
MSKMSKVEQYLIDLGISYQEISPEAWLVEDEGKSLPKMVVSQIEPVVVIRAYVMPVPSRKREELFETLLQLNSTDFLHGAYAIDGNQIVAVDTLEYENMDKNEFSASIEAMALALSQHYPLLSKFAEGLAKGKEE